MQFHIKFDFPPMNPQQMLETQSIWMGSCFAEHMGKHCADLGLPARVNPFGISYNPISIARQLDRIIHQKMIHADDIQEWNGLFFHYDFHGSFNDADERNALNRMNEPITQAHHYLKEAKVILITFGTAYAWRLKANNVVVNNCHKVSASKFNKRLLDNNELMKNMTDAIAALKQFNPQLQIVFTVSPVKYLRDGVIENLRSKSRLIELCHALVEQNNDVHYFPAYEILNEELRDHRFYKADMAHPNDQAIHYIWQRFTTWFYRQEAQEQLTELEHLLAMRQHRTLHPGSKESLDFESQMAKKAKELKGKHPFLHL